MQPQAQPAAADPPAGASSRPRVGSGSGNWSSRAQGLRSAADIERTLGYHPHVIHMPMMPREWPKFEVSIFTDIGGRKNQEDRFAFCPELVPGRDDCAFFGVFDGTVGDFASDTVKSLVVPHLLGSEAWSRVVELLRAQEANKSSSNGRTSEERNGEASAEGHRPLVNEEFERELRQLLEEAVDRMYLHADTELIELCARHERHYASSTSVTLVFAGGYCCIGHLGDSRVALGFMRDGNLFGDFLTADHKPNLPHERTRIVTSGGSVEYLHNHNNKPFIRGGDFTARKARGEQPMQLQYSRAFGGKDLKMYGLSNEPDLCTFRVDPAVHRVLILASDGLWDVQPAAIAVHIATTARQRGENPAEALVNATLTEQRQKKQNADNITAIVIFLKPDGRKPEVTTASAVQPEVTHANNAPTEGDARTTGHTAETPAHGEEPARAVDEVVPHAPPASS